MNIFLSDLDGTLLNKQGGISERDLAAIRRLQDHDICFGMVTGRDYGFCHRLIQHYQLPCKLVIGNNGGSIWIDDVKCWEEHMAAQDTLAIMEFLKDHLEELNPFVCNERSEFFLMRQHYPQEKWEEVKKTLSYLPTISQKDLLTYIRVEQEPIVKISIHTYTQECTDKWLPVLRERFGEQYEILPTSADYIEVTRKGIDKGKSLQWAMHALGIKSDEAAVIGDGANDIQLFQRIPMSFSMDTAKAEVQQEAAYVVKNVAEAIAFVIEYTTSNK